MNILATYWEEASEERLHMDESEIKSPDRDATPEFTNYVIADIKFEFPEEELYPNLPVVIDKNNTIYPSMGRSVCGLADILVAWKRGCKIELQEGVEIPFRYEMITVKKDGEEYDKKIYDRPFRSVIKTLQAERAKYEKGTTKNLLIKLALNSIYGATCSGVNHKARFNAKSEQYE